MENLNSYTIQTMTNSQEVHHVNQQAIHSLVLLTNGPFIQNGKRAPLPEAQILYLHMSIHNGPNKSKESAWVKACMNLMEITFQVILEHLLEPLNLGRSLTQKSSLYHLSMPRVHGVKPTTRKGPTSKVINYSKT